MSIWHCVEGDCHEPAVAWLTFTVDSLPRSFPFCRRHMERVLMRARRRRPDLPIDDRRRNGRQWNRTKG